MDTDHSNKSTRFPGNPSVGDVIRMLGNRIAVLHLHDNDTFTDRHKVPTTGVIDWRDVFNALEEIGYDGVYNMEIAFDREHFGPGSDEEEARYAVTVLRNMLD